MIDGKKVGVIIPAAGIGKRMGGSVAKPFLEVAGKPIIVRTLEQFQNSPEVDIIIIASDKKNMEQVTMFVNQFRLQKVHSVIEGGIERQDSVWNGLQVLAKLKADLVIIHDAVRPFISKQLIKSVLQAALKDNAVIVAVRPKDTIKKSTISGYAEETLNREQLWITQTPQVFQFSLIYNAFIKARSDNFYGTDDASLVERIGAKVRIVEGKYDNIKITTPEDLELAESIIKRFVINDN